MLERSAADLGCSGGKQVEKCVWDLSGPIHDFVESTLFQQELIYFS